MRKPTRRPPLDRLHEHTQTKRTTKRTTAHSPSLSEPSAGETAARAADYPIGHFGPEHGLTPAQAWEAQQLFNRANRRRPLRGPGAQARAALRMAGIIAAVKSGRVGNRAWGRRMHGKRGGQVMARQARHHLRAIAPLGSQAAAVKRQEKKARQETHDALPRLGERAGAMPWTGETGVSWPEEWQEWRE